jgi:hypothetical protein
MKAEPSRRGHFSARNHAASPTLRIVNLDLPPELRVTGTLKNLSLVQGYRYAEKLVIGHRDSPAPPNAETPLWFPEKSR